MRIPREVETKVVSRLYADAVSLDWPTLTSPEHSARYAKWVADPEIGGRLREYLSEGDVRLWIKDGPMKELSRAMSGVGRFASLIPGADTIPDRLVRKALDDDWSLIPGSVQGKPLRLVARQVSAAEGSHQDDDTPEMVLTWGQAADLKHLIWAALVASAQGDTRTWVLCVLETFTTPTPANEMAAHLKLAERCDLKVLHLAL